MSENLSINNEAAWLAIVKRQVQSIHFGVVQIVVHNDHVVQIERTEKIRLSDKVAGAGDDSSI
jgi:hypothetical protein